MLFVRARHWVQMVLRIIVQLGTLMWFLIAVRFTAIMGSFVGRRHPYSRRIRLCKRHKSSLCQIPCASRISTGIMHFADLQEGEAQGTVVWS